MYGYFDIGGTKTRVAISKDGVALGDPIKFDTPQNYTDGITQIAHELKTAAQGIPFTAIGGGIAGPIDPRNGALLQAPHLTEWVGPSIRDALAHACETPNVFLANDSAVVGLGEAHHGAGKGSTIMAYITVSTGVGGARIVSGNIDQSTIGFEPGHMIIDIDKTLIAHADEAEELFSGTALSERFHVKPYEVHDPAVWEELATYLAYALNNITVLWSPDTIVLGGSMVVGDPAIPIDRVEHHLKKILTIFPTTPAIKRAELRDLGGLYGALTYVHQCTKKL